MKKTSLLPGSRWGRAVVVGGGYTGLVTARVLAEHFGDVVVLERDPVTRDTGVHPHVPQGLHAHAVLAKGAETLEELFPGLRAELEALGSPVLDYAERSSFLLPTGFAPRDPVGVRIQTFTRDEVERRLRQRVLELPNVTLLAGTCCAGVTGSAPGRLDVVRHRPEDAGAAGAAGAADGPAEPAEPAEVTADLVVDASGRSTPVDQWLAAAHLPVSDTMTVKAKITYTSAVYERPPGDRTDFDLAYQMAFAPTVPRGGVILATEHHRWMCSLFGVAEHVPPTDDAGYLEFARSLDNPHLAEQIERGTRRGTIHRYTNPGNEWRLHHKNPGWPERLVAVGDAVCVFNPVYGQGLTIGALEAQLLGRMLRRRRADGAGLDGLSRAYQRAAARLIQIPWTLSTSSDLMWAPQGRPLSARVAHWYNQQLFAIAVHDSEVWSRFVRVLNMSAPPSLLFGPSVLAKVLRHRLTGRGRGGHGDASGTVPPRDTAAATDAADTAGRTG